MLIAHETRVSLFHFERFIAYNHVNPRDHCPLLVSRNSFSSNNFRSLVRVWVAFSVRRRATYLFLGLRGGTEIDPCFLKRLTRHRVTVAEFCSYGLPQGPHALATPPHEITASRPPTYPAFSRHYRRHASATFAVFRAGRSGLPYKFRN